MGQPVAVTIKRSAEAGRMRFELNRSLTGQEHEQYDSAPDREDTFGAVVAVRLFATGSVRAVHVMSNVVTADLAPGADPAPLAQIITDMYQYWKPGMVPTVPTA
ncbi:MAG: hypothetical protein ACKOE7_08320 [Actinomycetota bacterium]